MLYYRFSHKTCGGMSAYEAWTLDCHNIKQPVTLSSRTIQAVVAYAKKNGLTLQRAA